MEAMKNIKSFNGKSYQWSLPCDVNSSLPLGSANQFFEEAKRKKAMKEKSDYTGNEVESYETQRLLDHDTLAQSYEEVSEEVTIVPRFTTRATLQISATPVDDPIPLDLEGGTDKKIYDEEVLRNKVSHSKYSVFIPTYNRTPEEKKVDENGNALHQSNTKTKKKKKENVVVLNAESVEGHRSDIINDVDKLIQFIGGDEDTISSTKPKSNFHKSKQLKQHVSEDAQRTKNKRAHSSKGKESRGELKKSNSLGEISTTKLDNFDFSSSEKEENKVVLRTGKSNQNDKPKERRSWGNVEPPMFQVLSSNASTENLETAENWVVTKPKKKSKKRRNSISSGARRQNSTSESTKQPTNRAPSPDLRGNTTRSMPHSEKSNDSSDADSVNSLPIDDLNMPISYADIAKNSEKLKEKKASPEKVEKIVAKEKSPMVKADQEPKVQQNPKKSPNVEKNTVTEKSPPPYTAPNTPKTPPDVNNMKNFPAISADASSKNTLVLSPTNKHNDLQDLTIKNNTDIKTHNQELSNELQHVTKSTTTTPSVDVVVITKNTSSSSSSSEASHPPHTPKNVQDMVSSKNLPPDVHNIRNFPAMPNVSKNVIVSEKLSNSTKNNSLTVNNKIRNISPGSNNNNSKSAKSGHNNSSNLKSSARNASNVVHNDIQNDLTIIHSNEKESIQLNAQMLPPDIPDVRTIEKMHFMSLSPPNNVIVNCNQNQQHSPNTKNSPFLACSSPKSSTGNVHLPKVSHESTSVINSTSNNNKQTVNSCSNSFSNINNNANFVNCDNSIDLTVVSETVVVVDNHHQQPHQLQQQQIQKQEQNDEERPPVVILSGLGNKEVPGLVFGFDINEQLLNEDICENFISRYVEPENFKNSTHNHDKIVNFIGSAWESIITQSNGKVQYYKEES